MYGGMNPWDQNCVLPLGIFSSNQQSGNSLFHPSGESGCFIIKPAFEAGFIRTTLKKALSIPLRN